MIIIFIIKHNPTWERKQGFPFDLILLFVIISITTIIIFITIIISSLPEREGKGTRLTCWVPNHEGSQWLSHQDWHCQLPKTWVYEHRQRWSMRLLILRLFVSHWSLIIFGHWSFDCWNSSWWRLNQNECEHPEYRPNLVPGVFAPRDWLCILCKDNA